MVDKTTKIIRSSYEFHEINIPTDFRKETFKLVTDFYAATHIDGFTIYKKLAGNH